MASHDDDRLDDDGVYRSAPNRRRRVQVVAGVAGLAGLLGGAYLITDRIINRDSAVTQDVGALGPVTPAPSLPSPAQSVSIASTDASPTSATTSAAPTASPTGSANAAAVRRQIQAARDAAAKDGFPLQRPLQQRGQVIAENQITSRTEKTSEGTIRITSAKADLSGQRDQLLAADNGTPTGQARCTQKIHFSADAAPREIPTLLLCWRTSAQRSVVTLAVAKTGHPSAAASAATINREWSKLG